MARRSADRLLEEAVTGHGSFVHVVGRSAPAGLLSDQAWMTLSLVELYQATGHRRYLAAAQRTAEWAHRNLWDADSGGYFDRPADPSATALAAARNKPIDDSPSSSANAVMALALMKLEAVTGQQKYDERARRLLESFAGLIGRLGVHGGALAHAAEVQLAGVTRVVIIGPPERTAPLARAAHNVYTPGKVVLVLDPSHGDDGQQIRALGYRAEAQAGAYVCRGTQCLTAVTTAEELRQVLAGT